MDKPLASWVCVTFNRPHLLNELLYCFLAQDYDNKELIILNDQADIKYQYDDPRVKIYNLDKRFSALGAKRNYSKTLTNGEYVFITDDDDIYYSNHTSRLLNFHREHPEFDIVCNNILHFTYSNKNLTTYDVSVAFNGACIKKEYWLGKEFPNDKSCSEDVDFVGHCKRHKIDDGITTFHYRMGLDLINMSTAGFDGSKLYNEITEKTLIEKTKIITLIPTLSKEIERYYE